MILCTSVVLVVISPLSFLILFTWALFFFLMNLARGLTLSFQRTTFNFIDFLKYFLVCILFISILIFIISLFSLNWVLFVLFPGSFRCKVRLYLGFFLLLEVGLHSYELSSYNCFCFILYILKSCVFIFIYLQVVFDFLFDFVWSVGCLLAYCLISMLCFTQFSSCSWILVSCHSDQKICLIKFHSS